MSTRVTREKAVFCEALEITDPEQRRRFLDHACGADRALRQQVEKLLAFSPNAGDFFEDCAPALEPDSADAAHVLSEAEAALEPEMPDAKSIGPYKLLQKLGEGGCGVVYMAEQEQPIRRRVALKIIKLGMDTRNVIARFEAERQALALMDHPNIARVLDAGATETGRPYFVMELVYGVKITDYCDQNRVSMTERLELFIQVCNAVQHAHQKGIIHRDLKPSNIMVTMHDGVPLPKVIDFGIAKATEQRLTDKTLFTSYAQLMGTPAYMSPEQMELSGLNLDTRSDIYSLGVLLYELLTGRTPFDTTDLLKLGLDELRRTICEREPPRPSAKLKTLNNEELAKTARRRQIEPPRLFSQLRGDLDWIVLKCLEKDRTRRYEGANGLAMDIQRYLHEEAVLARPPSQVYRLQKLVRRNRIVFLSGAAAVAALLIGLGASTWLYFKERAAERQEAFLRHEAEVARGKEAELRHAAELHSRVVDATLLAERWNFEEAEKLLSGVPLEQPSPAAAAAVRALGDWHAAHDRWSEAVERFTALVKLDEFDDVDGVSLDYWALSIALVEAQDLTNYERFRRTTFVRFPEATETIADRIIKMDLLVPANPQLMADLSPYVVAAEKAFAGAEGDTGPNSFRAVWNALALGFLEYRKGNNEKAAEWCRRSIAHPRIEEPRDSTAHILLGMSLWRMNEEQVALDELRQGRTAIETKFRLGLGPRHGPEGNWFDWVFARRLLREADDLMHPKRNSARTGAP